MEELNELTEEACVDLTAVFAGVVIGHRSTAIVTSAVAVAVCVIGFCDRFYTCCAANSACKRFLS